ncbi:hypothetical protein C3744_27445 [Priestia megaterium]|uniref:Uncharacterized protein n=1 Tax=Priestia megaterium TaxID=1404 RepID=A0A3D8WV80_PRIMG|nr:DUF2178 domain-containing protein [Priestia megaterium]MDH3169164.1 DUF2178 domain-containing protein [Priestia megaterium]MDH3169212.1 DUF2178 domain-containing protein [Priestia megaterium]RDZ07693.1 hypothetical protein C3744_27445 [Priestia megaterium]
MMIIAIIIDALAVFYWATFRNTEGKDERGAEILGKASSVVLMLFVMGFTIITVMNVASPFTNPQFQTALSLCFSAVVIGNALSIMYYKKRI